MPHNNPKKQTGRALVSVKTYTPRSLLQMRMDEEWPKLYDVFLLRSADVSQDHICCLQTYFRRSFEDAVMMLDLASNGKMAHVGTYSFEVAEAKVAQAQEKLMELGQPLMSFAAMKNL